MIRFLSLLLLPWLAACASMAAPAHAAFTSDRIGVTVVGSGPDVVLIPGLSSSPGAWESTVAAVPGYRYHLIHVSGFAGRPAVANASGPVAAPVAEEIARYISEQGLRQPAVVGHSLGGAWAMMIAGRHPQLVSKVMVVDMLPFLGAMFGGPTATPDTLRPIAEQLRQGIASSTGAQRETTIRQTIASMVRTEGMRERATRDSLNSDAAVSGRAMYDLITTDLRPELRNIRVPMTVLWVHPPQAPVSAEQMAEFYRLSYVNVPQARIVQVPNSYHFIMWDEPAVFQRELRTFLGSR